MGKKEDAAEEDEKKVQAPPPSGVSVAIWGLLMFGACRAIEIFLEAQSMAGAVGQAVLVEWGSSRLGVYWSEPRRGKQGEPMTALLIAKRAFKGFSVGLTCAVALFIVLLATRGATTEPVAKLEASVLIIGLATSAIFAWRDELLFHGIALRAIEGTTANPLMKVLACGATSAGAAIGRPDATAKSIVGAALFGVILGTLWVRDRGAWQAWAANTGFRYATGTLFSGGIIHSRLAANGWAGGDAGMFGGTAFTVALAPLAILSLVIMTRWPNQDVMDGQE